MKRMLWLLSVPLLLYGRDWLVMVYMAADNDLAVYADSDLAEMKKVGSSEKVSIVVQVDRPYIGGQRLGILPDTFVVFENLGTVDMCDWNTLFAFMDWSMHNWPADRYLVILWDHGTGWTTQARRSFGTDYSSGRQMSIADGDFQKAFRSLYESTGKKIDLLAIDACAMQQVEVGYEIRNYAKVYLAVQGLWPLKGFPYDEILQYLCGHPDVNETDLARQFVDLSHNCYAGQQPHALSAIRADRLENLASQWQRLIAKITVAAPAAQWPAVRAAVQTLPEGVPIPDSTDDYIDLGDLIRLMVESNLASQTNELSETYQSLIIHSVYDNNCFSRTTGLTVWFPFTYDRFKQLVDYYTGLDWCGSSWPVFLNWFYQQDDIRPTPVQLKIGMVGGENDFRLNWNLSRDLAPVWYRVLAGTDTAISFYDSAEDTSRWLLNGFTFNTANCHSGAYALYSGNTGNLDNSAATRKPIAIPDFGVLDVFLNYHTQDRTDSLIIEYGPFRDVHYGYSAGWQRRRVILPPGNYPLLFRYRTDASTNLGGCFIDDIKIINLTDGRCVRENLPDTTLYIYQHQRGNYWFAILPIDRYGNTGNLSDFQAVSLTDYTRPYARPNPFQDECDLILDYPDSLSPTVSIFSLSGRKVRTFTNRNIIDHQVHWNGRDDQGRIAGAGLYFVFLKAGRFQRMGKIARQR